MKTEMGQVMSAVPSKTLDWEVFCLTYFPGRRPRHDFEAVIAYGAYRRLGVVPSAGRVESANGAAIEASSLAAWEDEGGGGSWARVEARAA
jgi:hypothetical protein